MSGAVFLFAGMVVNDPGPTLWIFGLAVLATISREIIKDIQDDFGTDAWFRSFFLMKWV